MKQRGRKSKTGVVATAPDTKTIAISEYPQPPASLTDEQKDVWLDVVMALEPNYFTRETEPLLTQYCQHVVSATRVAAMIEEVEQAVAFDVELEDVPARAIVFRTSALDTLYKMRDRESRALSMLATKMRIAQQSTRTHRGNKRPEGSGANPWD